MMRSMVWHWMVAVAFTGVFVACQSDQQTASQGEAKVGGTVIDDATLTPLEGASVRANSVALGSQSTVTNAQGYYEFVFELDSTASVELVFSKSGYNDKTENVVIQSAQFLTLNVEATAKSPIVPGGGGEGGSGLAQTIAFLSADPQEVSVYGVGGLETSLLQWEVRDSLGLPIDAAHSVPLSFTIVGGPNGGEYISPSTTQSNASGQAYTTFNSGVKSGVVQVVATGTVGSRTITTSPVRIVINAGFPDPAHFTVGPAFHNFPTLIFAFGKRDPISVLVGDKYSNPVVPNTALYLRTSAGVIQATVFTSGDGEGAADLISGNPQPLGMYADPGQGDGYHYAVARTIGEGGINVLDSTLILWSSLSQIKNVTPTTFDIPNGRDTVVSFNVSDYLGHPLSAGTKISVTASVPPPPCPDCPVNTVLATFGNSGSVVLDDYLFGGPGVTDFTFTISDGSTNIEDATPVTITISVTSENGNITTSLSGVVF
jgi:hypothetical protein